MRTKFSAVDQLWKFFARSCNDSEDALYGVDACHKFVSSVSECVCMSAYQRVNVCLLLDLTTSVQRGSSKRCA